MNTLILGFWAILTSAAVGTVDGNFTEMVEGRLQGWETKITQLREKAETAGPHKEARLLTVVRDLEAHRDRVRDELKRVSETETPLANAPAQASINRHLKQMDQLFSGT